MSSASRNVAFCAWEKLASYRESRLNILPDFTAQSQRASDKALTLLRRYPVHVVVKA
jgi:hypothetical protein